ncbi:MAG: Response regulator rcp1 [candidate division BRC1 bacterium ADurb.BinA292]|nr:MAG: Response regulator rcp1 [candidate division BRC1 bacterium ADurb.BinA292]
MPDDKTILLVEDNPDDVALTLRAFRKQNIHNEIVVAEDGVEALDYLHGRGRYSGRDASQQPTIILLDLQLPRMNGLEFLKELRSHPETKLMPVIVLTSSNEERDLVESYSRGANSYVRKPIEFSEFLNAVQTLGLYWLLINTRPPQAK